MNAALHDQDERVPGPGCGPADAAELLVTELVSNAGAPAELQPHTA